jgi:hypothetical protein
MSTSQSSLAWHASAATTATKTSATTVKQKQQQDETAARPLHACVAHLSSLRVYESKLRWYIVGCDREPSGDNNDKPKTLGRQRTDRDRAYRVLEIDRTRPGELRFVQTPPLTRGEAAARIKKAGSVHWTTGGLTELTATKEKEREKDGGVASFPALVGAIRLPRLHLLFVTKARFAAEPLPGRRVYEVSVLMFCVCSFFFFCSLLFTSWV